MIRFIPWLAGLITVVVALGTGLNWLSHHVELQTIALLDAFVIGVRSGPAGADYVIDRLSMRLFGRSPITDGADRSIEWSTYILYWLGIASAFVVTGIASSVHTTDGRHVVAYWLAAAVLIPGAWQLYKAERRSVKTCPDCAEEVKLAAHVCRYCGYRFSEMPAQSESS